MHCHHLPETRRSCRPPAADAPRSWEAWPSSPTPTRSGRSPPAPSPREPCRDASPSTRWPAAGREKPARVNDVKGAFLPFFGKCLPNLGMLGKRTRRSESRVEQGRGAASGIACCVQENSEEKEALKRTVPFFLASSFRAENANAPVRHNPRARGKDGIFFYCRCRRNESATP